MYIYEVFDNVKFRVFLNFKNLVMKKELNCIIISKGVYVYEENGKVEFLKIFNLKVCKYMIRMNFCCLL